MITSEAFRTRSKREKKEKTILSSCTAGWNSWRERKKHPRRRRRRTGDRHLHACVKKKKGKDKVVTPIPLSVIPARWAKERGKGGGGGTSQFERSIGLERLPHWGENKEIRGISQSAEQRGKKRKKKQMAFDPACHGRPARGKDRGNAGSFSRPLYIRGKKKGRTLQWTGFTHGRSPPGKGKGKTTVYVAVHTPSHGGGKTARSSRLSGPCFSEKKGRTPSSPIEATSPRGKKREKENVSLAAPFSVERRAGKEKKKGYKSPDRALSEQCPKEKRGKKGGFRCLLGGRRFGEKKRRKIRAGGFESSRREKKDGRGRAG